MRIYLLSILCLLTIMAVAQQREYKGEMSVTPVQLEQVGDSLLISIEFDISGVNVDSRRSISLTPVLVTPLKALELPEVMVKGRANYLTSKREVELMSHSERQFYNQDAPYAVVKGYKGDGQKRILYRKSIPFESWMKDARLDIHEDLCGCGNPPRLLAVSQLVNRVQSEKIEPYLVTPYLAYVEPEVEAIKQREMVGEAFLNFVVAKIDIRPDYMDNPRELKKITDMLDEVRRDPTISVKGIAVEGYASPEGTLKFNQYLSEGRANALVNHLLSKFNYPREMYGVTFGGENWKGLLEVIARSEMKYRDEVLAILTNETIDDAARKSQLKRLLDGEPYRYMVKKYYPELRKAICKIDYEVKGFDVVEAKEVMKSRPQNLSLNEMYLVANTLQIGSPEFIDVFETAARVFPEDETANLNAASAVLSRKDIVSAERYLSKIRSRVRIPEYDNAMGVLAMLQGNYSKSEEYLNSAAATGLESAKQNLKELHKNLKKVY